MKDLLLMRHAKSSWSQAGLADHERPLNPRGRRAAPDMGRRLAARRLVPARLIVSDALRAWQTAGLMAAEMGLDEAALVPEPRLYEADAADWLALIRELPDEHDCLGMLGHNPALEELAGYLVDLRAAKVPTMAVIHARFDSDRWADVAPGNGVCVDFDYPKRC